MADRYSESVRGVMRRRRALEAEDRLHHPLDLRLLRASVAADRLLHAARRVLGAFHAGERAGDEDGAARLSDRERGAGVDADEGLLEHDGIRPVLLDEPRDVVEDRLQAKLRTLAGVGLPPAVVDRAQAT